MDPIHKEYRRLRAKGWRAAEAWRAAKIRVRFEELEDQGDVKLWVEPEIDYYDDSYLETWGMSADKVERARKELRERIDRDGHWILIGYYREDSDYEWDDRHKPWHPPGFDQADNCGGFIGNDWKDSGYDVDIMQSCIDALDARFQREANELSSRATFAG